MRTFLIVIIVVVLQNLHVKYGWDTSIHGFWGVLFFYVGFCMGIIQDIKELRRPDRYVLE